MLNHFQHINLTDDQRNAVVQLSEFLESDKRVFILQGYAGSGKTTLISGLVHYLAEAKKQFEVMAPTGRAAKVLKDVVGYGKTIHKTIYNYQDLQTIQNEENKDDHSFHYLFPIQDNLFSNVVYIVDEASMISNSESKHELYTFGTNILLNDLLTFTGMPSRNKIIFVGDPAQLPPVTDSESKALSVEFFKSLGINAQLCVMKQVVRQKDNLILQNATKLRDLLEINVRDRLSFDYDTQNFIHINNEHIASQFVILFPKPTINQSVIIAYSNTQCYEYNMAVRSKLFPNNPQVAKGDLLIINSNNYHTYGVELMNGEMVEVVDVEKDITTRSNIPVYEDIDGERKKIHITLTFRRIKIRLEGHSDIVSCLIIDSLLNSHERDLTIPEMKALYVDYVMRFETEQKQNKEQGLPFYRVGSEEFKTKLKTDPYFNALRVKYGYAITCHKAQGGEWDTTLVDYYGRTGVSNGQLRWAYTATTRAVSTCYAANAPYLTEFSRFTVNPIQRITNVPHNALALNRVPVSPYHTEQQHRAKSLKFWEISEKLEGTLFQIAKVQSLGVHQERYTVTYQDSEVQLDSHHNEAGIFNDFKAVTADVQLWQTEVLDLINKPYKVTYTVEYTPSLLILTKLYGIMQSFCDELGITITNVEEKVGNYYVNYFLKTDAKFATIKFHFNGQEQLTKALTQSTSGSDDMLLQQLIEKLSKHVV